MSLLSSDLGAGNIIYKEELDIPDYVQESFDNLQIDQNNNDLHQYENIDYLPYNNINQNYIDHVDSHLPYTYIDQDLVDQEDSYDYS